MVHFLTTKILSAIFAAGSLKIYLYSNHLPNFSLSRITFRCDTISCKLVEVITLVRWRLGPLLIFTIIKCPQRVINITAVVNQCYSKTSANVFYRKLTWTFSPPFTRQNFHIFQNEAANKFYKIKLIIRPVMFY